MKGDETGAEQIRVQKSRDKMKGEETRGDERRGDETLAAFV